MPENLSPEEVLLSGNIASRIKALQQLDSTSINGIVQNPLLYTETLDKGPFEN